VLTDADNLYIKVRTSCRIN